MARTAPQAFFEPLEPRQLLSFAVWDGGGGDHEWSNPLNWSGDVLPGPNDNVLIDAPGRPNIHTDQDVSIASLWSLDPIDLSGGAFAVAGQWKQAGPLTVSGGTIGGAGNLLLNADLSWTGGAIAGDHGAKIQVLPARTVTIDGDVFLGRQLINNGSVVWAAGSITTDDAQIQNLAGRTFSSESPGSLTSTGAPTYFVNLGTLVRDGAADTATTIGVVFSNRVVYSVSVGRVEVRSGTLQFTGPVVEKQGERLAGGVWSVSSSAGQLLLPGPDIIDARLAAGVVLSGPGAAFPQFEAVRSVYQLELREGRAFTFSHLGEDPSLSPSNVVIDSPGQTIDVPRVALNELDLNGGSARALAGLVVDTVRTTAGARLELGGDCSIRSIAGAGTTVITGVTTWSRGAFLGSGQVQIAPGGTLRIAPGGSLYTTGNKLIVYTIVNDGTIEWLDAGLFQPSNEIGLSGEIVNRGQFNIHGHAFSGQPILSGAAPGVITNLGTLTIDVPGAGDFTLRSSPGPVILSNQGTVRVAHGRLLAYGGVTGGGSWIVAPGASLVFGGNQSTLVAPTFSGDGRIRVGNLSVWTNATILGTGDLIVGTAGRLGLFGTDTAITRSSVTNLGLISLALGSSSLLNSSFVNSGVLALSTGSLRITGNLTLTPLSVVRVRSASPTVHGSLSVGGTAALAGTLHAAFTWAAPAGTTVPFLTMGSRSGAFASLVSEGLTGGRIVQLQFVDSGGQVVVA